jgi:hypothetical protein
MKTRHKYYDPKQLDLKVMQAEALRQSADIRMGTPPTVVLHYHRYGESCDGKEHEKYIGGARQ